MLNLMQKLVLTILLLPGLAVTQDLYNTSKMQELKILDNRGLVRAFKNVNTSAKVLITFIFNQAQRDNSDFIVTIVQTDGLARDITGKWNAQNQYLFDSVSAGTWQVNYDSTLALIKTVKITPNS